MRRQAASPLEKAPSRAGFASTRILAALPGKAKRGVFPSRTRRTYQGRTNCLAWNEPMLVELRRAIVNFGNSSKPWGCADHSREELEEMALASARRFAEAEALRSVGARTLATAIGVNTNPTPVAAG